MDLVAFDAAGVQRGAGVAGGGGCEADFKLECKFASHASVPLFPRTTRLRPGCMHTLVDEFNGLSPFRVTIPDRGPHSGASAPTLEGQRGLYSPKGNVLEERKYLAKMCYTVENPYRKTLSCYLYLFSLSPQGNVREERKYLAKICYKIESIPYNMVFK